MCLNVIITTSGIGSRLGELTKYTNKCLVRIDDKPAISHIIENYPDDTKFTVTLGHFGSHIRQFLTLAYPNKNFEFVEIDKYKGQGSSLGYSLSKCKKFINEPFIYHACDTIVKDLKIKSKNFIVGSYKNNVSQYRTVKYSTKRIYEKGEIEYDLAYVGICGVENYVEFFDTLDQLLAKNTKEISEVDVLNILQENENFEIIKVNEWYDIGNNSELLNTRSKFKSSFNILDKPEESIYFFDNYVIKFFSDSNIALNRVKRAKHLGCNIPQIISSTENFYKYEKVQSSLLASVISPKNFIKLLDWSKDNLWITKDHENFDSLCFDFYYHKTLQRINKYLSEFEDTENIINDERIPNIFDLIERIDFEKLSKGVPVNFHGDFILDNILFDGKEFKLLDWRQDFQGSLTAGDLYYDLAKLNHNLTLNHYVLDHDLFKINYSNEKEIRCEVFIPSINLECQKIYHQWLINNNFDLFKVKLLTCIIWLNMAVLHKYPLNKFLFYFGKYNLNLVLRTYNE